MLKIDVLTIDGKKEGQVSLPGEIFAAKINSSLMAQAVKVYLSNQRKAKAKVKNRGEITGSTKKIWKQKGTGRARHGDRYAPIFVGGGVAHGPTGRENFKLKMSRKMRKAALFSALTGKFKEKNILVVSGLAKIEPKTKKMAEGMRSLELNQRMKILLVTGKKVDNVLRAARNLAKVTLLPIGSINTYQVLMADKIVFMKEAIEELGK